MVELSKDGRVVMVGLDGATFDALDPLVARGLMPNLAALMAEGVRAPLASTVPGWTPPGWTSIATGLNPGGHGILYANTTVDGEYPGAVPGGVAGHPISALDVHGAPMWRALSAAGRRSCILLVPLTYPPEPVNGTLVAGMFRPREATDYVHPPAETPPDAWRFDPSSVLKGGDARHDDPLEVARTLHEIAEENADAFERELRREAWDLFFGVFMAPDRLGHYFWSRFGRLDEGEEIDREILGCFRAIDRFLGVARAERDAGATVVLVSDHGSGAAALDRVNVVRILEEAGLLRTVREGIRRRPVVPMRFDWERTEAFPIYMGDLQMVGIGLNLRGRWPRGSAPPDRAESIARRVEKALLDVRVSDGSRAVRRVLRGVDVYAGPFASRFPDLVAELDERFMPTGSPDGPLFEPHRDAATTTWGSHRQDGILVLSGPGVRAGAVDPQPHVEDVAPTVLALLGLSFAHPVDGRVLSEVLEPRETVPAPAVAREREPGDAPATSPGEEAEIEGMLRGLGYIE